MSHWTATLQETLERRLPALTRTRAPEVLPIRLHRRRIYILPTRTGLGFGLLLIVMLLGALNYQNNAALLLTCLLGAAIVNSMLIAFRVLDGLRLTQLRTDPACAGDPLPLHLHFDTDHRKRPGLNVDAGDYVFGFSLDAVEGEVVIAMPTERRGWTRVPRLRVSSTQPFGLFRAWSWIAPKQDVLVYPRPLHGPAAPPSVSGTQRRERGEEDYAQLREYRFGDPLKRVAWKASARHDRLLIRELDSTAPDAPLRFEWNMLHGVDHETRIGRLAGWVHEAHASGRIWVLVLPDGSPLGPQADHAHYHRCMTALALLP